MPLFAYKALSSSGGVQTGEVDAADRPEALRVLDKRGLQPVSLKETAAKVAPASIAVVLNWQEELKRLVPTK